MANITYITKELSEKTHNKRIIDAYERNYLTVSVIDNKVYYIQTDPASDSLHDAAKKEIKKYFPGLIDLYELRR